MFYLNVTELQNKMAKKKVVATYHNKIKFFTHEVWHLSERSVYLKVGHDKKKKVRNTPLLFSVLK